MGLRLLNPRTKLHVRSVQKGNDLLTGRLCVIDSNGQAVNPGSGSKLGTYLVVEGTHQHEGGRTDFAGTTPYFSTDSTELPAVKESGEVAIVRAQGLVYEVGPEGFDPAQTYTVGALLDVGAAGRLTPAGSADGDEWGRVEAVTADGSGNPIQLRVCVL